MSQPAGSALAGIGLVILAPACFATLDTNTRYVSASVPLLMALWVRYAFQAVVTAVVVLPLRGRSVLRTAHPRFQLLRGVLLLTTSLLAFFSLKYMPVGEFTALVMIVPLLMTLLAATTMGEQVSPLRWALVVGGFVGTLTIIRPGHDAFNWATLLPLGLVVSNTWFQLLTSRLAKTEDPLTLHFYTGWVGMFIASVLLPWVWTSVPDSALWDWLIVMGLMGTVGHFLLILAYQRVPSATLTPYFYGQIGFAMLGGWMAFSHVPDSWSLAGMTLIALCGAAGARLAMRESRTRASIRILPPESRSSDPD